jgi:hypothetical protein
VIFNTTIQTPVTGASITVINDKRYSTSKLLVNRILKPETTKPVSAYSSN